MRRKWIAVAVGVAAVIAPLGVAKLARSSDHQDGAQAKTDLTADITDLFAWMSSDGTKVNLVLDVLPFATPSDNFSSTVQYVVHTESRATATAAGTPVDIICTFDVNQVISCWLGATDYVTGDASNAAGLASTRGSFKVFAGKRDDPAFWNRFGFLQQAALVHGSSYTRDVAGCPTVSQSQATQYIAVLNHGLNGLAPKDDFAGANVFAIVLQVDKAALTQGGPVLTTWASTRRSP